MSSNILKAMNALADDAVRRIRLLDVGVAMQSECMLHPADRRAGLSGAKSWSLLCADGPSRSRYSNFGRFRPGAIAAQARRYLVSREES